MAEIRVEKKKKSSILPWILGLALLALVVWGLSQMGDPMTTAPRTRVPLSSSAHRSRLSISRTPSAFAPPEA